MKFEKQISRELSLWKEKQIISEEQAEQIQSLYPQSRKANYNVTLILFSVIGALLIGSGIILIFGRNWNELPVWARTCIAFLPLVISQLITAFLLYKKVASEAWREGVGLFYAISVYACIALIGQIYQVPGNFEGYLLLCSLLVFPVCYILKATTPMLIYIIGITVWTASFYGSGTTDYTVLYFIALLLLTIPHVWVRFRENVCSAYSQLLLWCLGICGFVIACSKLPFSSQYFVVISLYFSLVYMISAKWMDSEKPVLLRPLKVIGFFGNMVMLVIMSNSFGQYFFSEELIFSVSETPQIIVTGVMALLCLILMVVTFDRENPLKYAQTLLIGAVFLVALIMQLVTPNNYMSSVNPAHYLWVNLYILAIGVILIINGLVQIKFSYACLGTVLISCVIIFRFFDTELDFLARGLAFIAVGIAFLVSNIFIAKRIKKEASDNA